ncbi:hypothetical protein VTO42DRAFT_3267 [Malbranchea cinnamomea]
MDPTINSEGPRKRKLLDIADNNEVTQGTLGHIGPQHVGDYGLFVQVIRSLVIITCFTCACVTIVATQLVGTPLYFINRNYFNSYIAMTKRSFGIVITALTEWASPTPVRISGDKSVQGQIGLTKDGRVKSDFAQRLVLIANHQVYTDWIYLWWAAYTNETHGYIYIILKESLKYIPLIGQGMMLYGFIFMARKWVADKPRMQHRLEKLKAVRPTSSEQSPKYDPMWLLIFPEGTNLSPRTEKISRAYAEKQGIRSFDHILLPRSTGLFFCLQQLKGTVDWVYDCTIAYDGHPKDVHPEAYFTLRSTYLRKCPPKVVNFYWRRFAVSSIPLEDQRKFEAWLYERWAEKDQLMKHYMETGKFPPFEYDTGKNGAHVDGDGENRVHHPAYIESEIKLGHWTEVGKVFAVLVTLGIATRLLL